MPYWWVNHRWTYREETNGGYLWSPKLNKNGARNQTYSNMALVAPGDTIFSYADQLIRQVGIATGVAASSPKPTEFGSKGDYWSDDGWLLPVRWIPLSSPLRPKEFISEFRSLLPEKNSPISADGNGRQNTYLAAVSEDLAHVLVSRLGGALSALEGAATDLSIDDDEASDRLQNTIANDTTIDSTEREDLIRARRGQGRFRRNLESVERGCRLTGVTDRRLLRASHIKPWRLCENNHERLDGHNGLLLTPTFDLLFDRGFLTFRDDGSHIIGTRIPRLQLSLLGIGERALVTPRSFTPEQQSYLAFHRRFFGFG